MIAKVITRSGLSNRGTEEHCGRDRRELRLISEVMRAARGLWPNKTAAELRYRTGVSQRTVENWLQLKTGISGPALSALQASEEGLAFIEAAIIAQGKGLPVFWKRFKRRQETAALKRDARQIQLRLEKLDNDE
jgi:hypothetical protein